MARAVVALVVGGEELDPDILADLEAMEAIERLFDASDRACEQMRLASRVATADGVETRS